MVDLTAAADAFVGGFIAAKARKLNSAQALLWADAAGTICTQRAGAQVRFERGAPTPRGDRSGCRLIPCACAGWVTLGHDHR